MQSHDGAIGQIEIITGGMFSGKSEELVRRLRRAAIARQRVQVFKPATDTRHDPARLVMDKLDTQAVTAAIEALPEEFRLAASLYFLEDFSYQEIADVLECPVGTVRSRLHRGRRLLQKALWDLAVEAGLVSSRDGGED